MDSVVSVQECMDCRHFQREFQINLIQSHLYFSKTSFEELFATVILLLNNDKSAKQAVDLNFYPWSTSYLPFFANQLSASRFGNCI